MPHLPRTCALLLLPIAATTPTACKNTPPPVTAPRAPAPLVLPSVRASTGWQELVDRAAVEPELGEAVPLAFGVERALLQTQQGVFEAHATRGVIGRVPLPEGTRWVGLDGDDALWFATRSGGVFVSATPQAAATAREVATIPGAIAWDVTRKLAAVATATALHLSVDGGATWRQVVPRPGVAWETVATRWDGIIVAQGREVGRAGLLTVVSRDRGATWANATFQPTRLRRDGGWIWSGDLSCPATLSQDGVTWSSDPHVERSPGLRDPRARWLTLTSTARSGAGGVFGRLDTPPPPADPKQRHVGTTTTCQDPIIAPRRRVEAPRRGQLPPPCAAGRCLRHTTGDAPEATRHRFRLLADGACQAAHADRDGLCRADAPWTRAPHVALLDQRAQTLTTLKAPDACQPARLWTVRGMAVLLCRTEAGRALYTRAPSPDPRTPWALERVEALPAAHLMQLSSAADGTLILHGACPEDPDLPCAPSLLRRPEAPTPSPAATARWRVLDRPHLTTARPLSGGRALLATTSTKTPDRLTLWLVDGAATKTSTADDKRLITLDGLSHPVRDLLVSQGVVRLRVGESMRPPSYVVRDDGALGVSR